MATKGGKAPTHTLSVQHEEEWAEWLGTTRSRGSGNQWNHQMDGRTSRTELPFAFAFDCKAAMPGTASIGVSYAMLLKAVEQANHERPILPLRFYETERGGIRPHGDWVLVKAGDFLEMERIVNGRD